MITQQDLATLERLYTPLAKILSEHLRMDHGYSPSGDRFKVLFDENTELRKELADLKSDYEALSEINQKTEQECRAFRGMVSCCMKGPLKCLNPT